MIEKKISYDINIEKPSKTKPVKQGGVFNYLGKQKTVNAPVKWRSSPKHPIAHLAYITKDEEKILVDLNLYGSLKGKPNKGPSGIMSLNGGGGGSEGAGTSDTSGPSESPGGAETGFGIGPDDSPDAPDAPSDNLGFSPDIGGIVGPGPGQQNTTGFGEQDVTGFGTSYSDADMGPVGQNAMAGVDMSTPALQTMQEKAMAQARNTFSPAGIFGGLIGASLGIPGGFGIGSKIASDIARGVTAPGTEEYDQDYAKMDLTTDVVNVGPPSFSPGGGDGGIKTIQAYAPTYNPDTGNPTMDAYIKRLRINLGLPV